MNKYLSHPYILKHTKSIKRVYIHKNIRKRRRTNWEELLAGMTEANIKILQRICKACNKVGRKDKELWGRSNGVIGGYHK